MITDDRGLLGSFTYRFPAIPYHHLGGTGTYALCPALAAGSDLRVITGGHVYWIVVFGGWGIRIPAISIHAQALVILFCQLLLPVPAALLVRHDHSSQSSTGRREPSDDRF